MKKIFFLLGSIVLLNFISSSVRAQAGTHDGGLAKNVSISNSFFRNALPMTFGKALDTFQTGSNSCDLISMIRSVNVGISSELYDDKISD